MITCAFENGGTTSLRHVTVDAIVQKDGQVLMVRRNQSLVEGGKWAIPGGFLQRDERPEEGALRELKEETGWDGQDPQLFVVCLSPHRANDTRNWQNINFAYIVTASGQTGKHDWESTDVEWFPLDGLPDESMIAFDHANILQAFAKYKKSSHPIPLIW